jgi:hypothetical protein
MTEKHNNTIKQIIEETQQLKESNIEKEEELEDWGNRLYDAY